MQLVERRVEDLSDLRYEIFSCDLGGKHHPIALVIRFIGVHGVGSAGNGESHIMYVMTRAVLTALEPQAVDFDLRQLDYKMGKSIWLVWGPGIPSSGVYGLPSALVVPEGFSTSSDPPSFDSLELALEYVA